jgi:lysophospholipase L1-like esterase
MLSFPAGFAQIPAYSFELPQYEYIHYESNHFEFISDNPSYLKLFAKFDTLLKSGTNQIKIVHIGGSHIQADIYTHRIRQEMQSFYPGILGSRGFFFPFKIAGTNSPSNLWIQFTGEWETCKNTQPDPVMPLGLSGITSELKSNDGSIIVVASYDSLKHYDFNRVRIFCNTPVTGNIPAILPRTMVKDVSVHTSGMFVQYDLWGYADTLSLSIQQDTVNKPFQLYGISLENDDPGVIYNAIGVNGAMLKSYLGCRLLTQQLEALEPDWVIISIGTNEGNTRDFDEEAYKINYKSLIDSIRHSIPEAAILLTVPNDSYLQKRYINQNTALIRDIIFRLAEENDCGVWDFYTIMGGLNSAKSWFNNGLMSRDHIHFSKQGYLLKGDLFYNAFMNSWSEPSFLPASTLR